MKNIIHKVLVDTDIVIDFLTKREPFAKEAAQLFNLADQKKVQLYISSLCLNNIYYLFRKVIGHKKTLLLLQQLVEIVEILALDKQVVIKALNSNFSDFEDALQNFAAVEYGNIGIIITRNLKDYKQSKLAIMTAASFNELVFKGI